MRTWIEISKPNLKHNLNIIRQLVGPKVLIAPCIKANAYGHGLLEIASLLDSDNSVANWLCVQSVEEGSLLRANGIKKRILLISGLFSDEIPKLIQNNIKTFVFEKQIIQDLNAEANKQNKIVDVHLLVNTGMGWFGVQSKEVPEYARIIKESSNLNFEGITTHFSTSDEFGNDFFEQQLSKFEPLWQELQTQNLNPLLRHCANSGALLRTTKSHFDLVQPGICMYGLYPSKETQTCFETTFNQSLLPVLSLKSRIASIKKLPSGHGIGYSNSFVTKKETIVGTLPIGYFDGYDRGFGNLSSVEINGKFCPVLGRISMNSTMIDLSSIKDSVQIGEEVTIISSENSKPNSTDNLAKLLGTINYEVTTRLNSAIPRIMIK